MNIALGLSLQTTLQTAQQETALCALEQTLAQAEQVRQCELDNLNNQIQQAEDQYRRRTQALLHEARSVLVPPTSETSTKIDDLHTALHELHNDYEGAKTVSADLEHEVEVAYLKSVDGAFATCFALVRDKLRDSLSAASPLEEKRPLYDEAKKKLINGTADAIDRAIVTEFERSEKQAGQSLDHILFPVRIHDTRSGQVHIDIPLQTSSGRPGRIYNALISVLSGEKVEMEHGTRVINDSNTDMLVSALSAVNSSTEFTTNNVELKIYRTEGSRDVTPVRNEATPEQYSITDLAEIFNVTRSKMNGVIYKKIARNDIEQHSELCNGRGATKKRIFDAGILSLIEKYLPKPQDTKESEQPAPLPVVQEEHEEEVRGNTRDTPAEDHYDELVSIAHAANVLRYKTQSAVHNNVHLTKVSHDDGKTYVTTESLNGFIEEHEYNGTRWIPRRNALAEGRLLDEIERPMPLSKRQRRVLRHYDRGLNIAQIAKKLRVQSSTIHRNLRSSGVYSRSYIESQFPNLETIKTQVIPGVRSYPKDAVRIDMLEQALSYLKKKGPIRYLGLEGPHFCSYIEVARLAAKRLRPSESLIAEKDELSYRIMQSFAKHSDVIEGGEIFDNLNIQYGELHDVVANAEEGMKLNLVNLDYEGHVSTKKMNTLKMLFEKNMLDDPAVFFVTLNDSPRIRARVNGGNHALGEEYRNGFGTSNQEEIIETELVKLCKQHKFGLKRLGVTRYESRKSPMLIAAYEVWR